ncbi:hypothetical protein KW807_01315 [Candidatus Parcubacteria bacterium]|nr:hypothetical protein [Candidatus Parcubacteria bacterium]
MKNLFKLSPLLVSILMPQVAFGALGGVKSLITSAGALVNTLTGIVFAIGLLVFFFGLVKFIFKVGGDEKAVTQGRTLMIWGLLTLFVMSTVWGLVYFIRGNLLGVVNNRAPDINEVILK